jgi:N-acetylmuramoyl-L-alanine amidase
VTQHCNPILKAATLCLLALTTAASRAQAPAAQTPSAPTATPSQRDQSFYVSQLPKPAPALYRNLIFLDAAHGGSDTGARLPNNVLEKDVTLALASRIKALLAAAGFYVVSSHETDTDMTTDQRAEIANHARPAACIVLHATSTGSGVHIFTSALTAPDDPTAAPRVLPWDTAQAYTLPQSLRFANQIGLAFTDAKLPVILTQATVRPLDNLTCPAVAIELAPLASGSSSFRPTDSGYQQRVAQAIATALTTWRTLNAPPPSQANPTGVPR